MAGKISWDGYNKLRTNIAGAPRGLGIVFFLQTKLLGAIPNCTGLLYKNSRNRASKKTNGIYTHRILAVMFFLSRRYR